MSNMFGCRNIGTVSIEPPAKQGSSSCRQATSSRPAAMTTTLAAASVTFKEALPEPHGANSYVGIIGPSKRGVLYAPRPPS
jgi:hypothetical protein